MGSLINYLHLKDFTLQGTYKTITVWGKNKHPSGNIALKKLFESKNTKNIAFV